MTIREMPMELNETLRRMCEEYERNQQNRFYGYDDHSAENRGVLRTGQALRQCVRRNVEEFVGIARAVTDELGSTYFTIHCNSPGVESAGLRGFGYYAQLWTRIPLIDGESGNPVSGISVREEVVTFDEVVRIAYGDWFVGPGYRDHPPRIHQPDIFQYNTRITYLQLLSGYEYSDQGRSQPQIEQEREELIQTLNRHDVQVGQESLVRVLMGRQIRGDPRNRERVIRLYELHSANHQRK